jgi:hypothetical protein
MGWTVRDSNSGRSDAGVHAASFSVGAGWVGMKQPGHEANHLPPTGVMVKMSRAIPLLPLYAFMMWTRTAVPLPFPLDLPILKVACAVHAGLLDELQHMIRLNPKSWRILEVGRESLNTQVTVNWFLATASVGMWWTVFVMLLHHTNAVTLRLRLFTAVRIHIVVFFCVMKLCIWVVGQNATALCVNAEDRQHEKTS